MFDAFQYNFCYCSMILNSTGGWKISRFQYNFCYCSMHTVYFQNPCYGRFNTTFVTVLWFGEEIFTDSEGFQYNFCYCSIQDIHTGFWYVRAFQYNFCYCSIIDFIADLYDLSAFQYNFCYCSIYAKRKREKIRIGFNTTFVTVL